MKSQSEDSFRRNPLEFLVEAGKGTSHKGKKTVRIFNAHIVCLNGRKLSALFRIPHKTIFLKFMLRFEDRKIITINYNILLF